MKYNSNILKNVKSPLITTTAIRRGILSTKFCTLSPPIWSHSWRKAWVNSCRFCDLISRESTAHCSSSHRCPIRLQSGESRGWYSTVTPSCIIKSWTIRVRWTGTLSSWWKIVCEYLASHGNKFPYGSSSTPPQWCCDPGSPTGI